MYVGFQRSYICGLWIVDGIIQMLELDIHAMHTCITQIGMESNTQWAKIGNSAINNLCNSGYWSQLE